MQSRLVYHVLRLKRQIYLHILPDQGFQTWFQGIHMLAELLYLQRKMCMSPYHLQWYMLHTLQDTQ
jgi:hypothetical protein